MVTANRRHLAARAVTCFLNQTYENKELVIIDDGEDDYSPILGGVPPNQLKYVKLKKEKDFVLGKLRNRSLDEATGDYLVQWDDDDWYHPERIEIQVKVLKEGYDACCLSGALMHLDNREYLNHPYIGYLPNGIPGSIMHRSSTQIRYPETRRAEDTVYLKQWMKKRYKKLDHQFNHLFLRAYHGNNTWEAKHFIRRIRNSIPSAIAYFWYAVVRRNVFNHPRFRLTPDQKAAFEQYVSDSKNLGLLS